MKIGILVIIFGIIILGFGILFDFQGQGIVGPESSFMYENPEWIINGHIIGIIGIVIVIGGLIIRKKLKR